MTTLIIDGFDHYGTLNDGSAAMLTAFYTETPETTNPTNLIGPSTPNWGSRSGDYSLGTGGGTGGDCYRFPLPSTQTNILVSCGFSVSNLPSGDAELGVCSFRDGANKVLAELWLTTTGALELRGPAAAGPYVAGSIIASTITSVITPEYWHFLEMQINTASRAFTLRVDDTTGTGTAAISVTSQVFGTTAAGAVVATAPISSVALLQRKSTTPTVTTAWLDDLVVRNTSGTKNNSFAGETFVATSYPVSTLIPPAALSSVISYNEVDLPPEMTRVSSSATVITAYKTGAGVATITPAIVGPLKNIVSGAANTLTSTAKYYTTIFETNPDADGQLTPITLAEGGYRLTPVTADTAPRINQIVGLVVYQTDVAVKTRQRCWTFELDGHTFYVLDLGEEGTFAYDVVTKQWCHLYSQGFNGQWNFVNGTMWGDRIVAGDLLYNLLWELDPNEANDEGWRLIKHVVTGGISTRNQAYVTCNLFHVVGSSGQTQSVTPSVLTLNFSDDNGKTWSSDFPIEIEADATDLDIQWPALGAFTTPGRIFRLTDEGGLIRIDGASAGLGNYKDLPIDGDR